MSADENDLKRRMDGALDALKREFAGLRTGRASTSLLENIQVDAYGSPMPMNQVASVSVPEATLDHEADAEHVLVLSVADSDGDPLSDSTTVTITVTNVTTVTFTTAVTVPSLTTVTVTTVCRIAVTFTCTITTIATLRIKVLSSLLCRFLSGSCI